MDIPNTIKVRIREERGSDIPLGYATFYDMSTKKLRKDKSWNAWGDKELGEFPNVPKAGFAVVGHESRNSGYNSSRTLFRIKHPDGFLFEIELGNFFDLLNSHTIEKGLFQGNFVLGWNENTLMLISNESELYHSSIELKRQVDKGYVRDFEIGKAYKLKGGQFVGYYAGQRTVAAIKYENITPTFNNGYKSNDYPYNVKIAIREVHIFHSAILSQESEYNKPHEVMIDGKMVKIITETNCWATPKVYSCTDEECKEVAKSHIFQPDALDDIDFYNNVYFNNATYYKMEYQLINRSVKNQDFIDLITKTFPESINLSIEYSRAAYSLIDSNQPTMVDYKITKP